MANIFYLTRSDFLSNTFGGGMKTKTDALSEAWTDGGLHKVVCGSDLSRLQGHGWRPPEEESEPSPTFDVVVLELLGLNNFENFDANLAILESFSGPVLVYGSDSELLRWRGKYIEALKKVVYGWIANCQWQARYFQDYRLPVLGIVREPIDCDLFRPSETHEKVIVASGNISYGKRTDFFIDLFSEIKKLDTAYKTAYIGEFSWGGKPSIENLKLRDALKVVVDVFHGNVSPARVSAILSTAGIGVLDAYYETCNRFGMELQASGVYIAAGSHICFDEWPHVQRFTDLESCLSLLSEATQGYEELPPPTTGNESTQWAKSNFSYEASLNQLNMVLRGILS